MSRTKKKNKILIIDDDPMNLLILEEILGDTYNLVSASTGGEAPLLAKDFNPDLILLDIMLPDTTGYDVCKELRENPKFHFTKIILVSAKSLLKDRLKGYQAGADDYISKPFDPDELLAKVQVFIRLKSVQEIERVKDDLINVFSHETRTPLNAIIGFAKLMKESPNLEDDEKEGVDLIIESGYRLLELSNKAITLSKLRKETTEIYVSETNIDNIFNTAVGKLDRKIKDKDLVITNKLSEIILSLDLNLIEQSLIYILDNAIKFSPSGSEITIYSEISPSGEIHINVKDSGKGIPPEKLGDLFDEFGVEDVSHHSKGHGLSLAIVKYTMELHGGDVMADNAEDGGAIFSLIFPNPTKKS